jgi:hypothetical protein
MSKLLIEGGWFDKTTNMGREGLFEIVRRG